MFSRNELKRVYVTISSLTGGDPETELKTDQEMVTSVNEMVKNWYEINIDPLPSKNAIENLFEVAIVRIDPSTYYETDKIGGKTFGERLLEEISTYGAPGDWNLKGSYQRTYEKVYIAMMSTL